MAIRDMIKLARPAHWIKNVFVLMPVVFGMKLAVPAAWGKAAIATIAFCLASSFAYIINDIKDAESDRLHPHKKDRPIAAGRITVKTGLAEAFVLLVLSAAIAYSVSVPLLIMVGAYVLLQVCYSELFKRKVLLDVICIAIGFVLRAVAGAVAIDVEISPWLFVCMFTLCMFLGFCKRYNEVVTLGDVTVAANHRPTLLQYTPDLLTHLITISAGIAVVGFLLYSLNERTVENFGTDYFVYTLPVVVYAIFRFAMLSMKGVYSDPTDLILHDKAFQITVVIWLAMAMTIISYGPKIQDWVESFSV
jgi:decaprenyl-phosphate phosphoribosyltransferase